MAAFRPGDKVQIMVVDPPWQCPFVRRKKHQVGKTGPSYHTWPMDAVFAFFDRVLIPALACSAHIFVWCIDRNMWQVESFLRERLRFHCRLVWCKRNAFPLFGSVKRNHEYVLWFWKGKFIRPAGVSFGRSCFHGQPHARLHSAKPEAFYDMLDEAFQGLVKADVFARRKREGWYCWPVE